MNKYLYVFRDNGDYSERIVECLPDRWVKVLSGGNEGESFPIEDFGDYTLSDEKIENPFEEWLEHLKEG